jgi:hypothetical protein
MTVRRDVRSATTADDLRIHGEAPQIAEIDATLALDQFASPKDEGGQVAPFPVPVENPNRLPEGVPMAAVQRNDQRQRRAGRPVKVAAAAVLVAAAAATAFIAAPAFSVRPQAGARQADGVLVLQSDPTGVGVSIDGRPRGSTPLEVPLAPGRHELAFGTAGAMQRVAVTVAPGSRSTHYLHLLSGPAPGHSGVLQLTGAPNGTRVSLDGVARGRTPLRLDDVAAGPHRLSVAYDSGSVEQQVTVEAGRLTTVVLPARAAGVAGTSGVAAAGGWLEIASPEIVQVWERDQLVGTSQTARIMLPAGSHPLELVNEDLGYRERRMISITAGATNKLSIQLPQGTVSVNAVPWAEVWIDGRHVGDTPLGEFSIAAGRHAVTLRHPQLGEKQQQAVVRVGESTAITADLRR